MLILMHAYLYIRNSIRNTTQHDGHHLFFIYITSIGLTLYSNAYDDLRLCVLFVFFSLFKWSPLLFILIHLTLFTQDTHHRLSSFFFPVCLHGDDMILTFLLLLSFQLEEGNVKSTFDCCCCCFGIYCRCRSSEKQNDISIYR